MSAQIESIKVKEIEVPVIFEKDNNLPIVSMQLIFRGSGSMTDGKDYGLARFGANVFNEGTKELGSTKFAEKLENKAVYLGASCGTETFVFELSSLRENFDFGAEMLSKLLQDPNLTKKAFEKVQTMTLGAISSKKSDFDHIANVNLKKTIFKDTPIGHEFSGTEDSIKDMKLEDIKNFLSDHIVLNNAIIVIGGDLNLEEAKKYTKSITEVLNTGKNKEIGFYTPNEEEKTIVEKKDTQQAYIYFGAPYKLKSNDKDAYKSKVAAFILGAGGFGSRMMEEIRVERGLAYSAYSRVNLNKSHSSFTGHLQTKIESKDEAIKIVRQVIADFVEKGVSEKELESAKKFLLGSEPLRVETLSQRLGRAFFEYYKGFKPGYYKKELAKIRDLKLKDLNEFIKSHKEINKLSFSIVTK